MDMLFSNAGIGESGWFEDVPFEAALRVVQVNLIGVLASIYAALPLLKATPGSMVFITSSSSATYGMPRIAVYSATKHAVKGLTEALSVEFVRHGVRVADVLPGLIDTAILRSTPNRTGDRPKPTEEEFYANAPRKGMFRLLAGHASQRPCGRPMAATGCTGMCRQDLVWLDRLKALFPRFTRSQIAKQIVPMVAGDETPGHVEKKGVDGAAREPRCDRQTQARSHPKTRCRATRMTPCRAWPPASLIQVNSRL